METKIMTETYCKINRSAFKAALDKHYVQKFDESTADYPYLSLIQAEDLANTFAWMSEFYRSQVKTFKKLVEASESLNHNPRFTQYSIAGEPGRRFVDIQALRHFRPDLFRKYGSVNSSYAAACLPNDTLIQVLLKAGISEEDIYRHYDVSLTSVEAKMTDEQKEKCIRIAEPKREYFWSFAEEGEEADSYNGEQET